VTSEAAAWKAGSIKGDVKKKHSSFRRKGRSFLTFSLSAWDHDYVMPKR